MIDLMNDFDNMASDGPAHMMPIIAEIHTNKDDDKNLDKNQDGGIPILALRNMVLFPGMTMPVAVGRSKSMALIKEAQKRKSTIGVICQIDADVDDPDMKDLYKVGTLAEIIKILELPDNSTNVILQGRSSFQLEEIVAKTPYLKGFVKVLDEIAPPANNKEFRALLSAIKEVTFGMLEKVGEGGREMSFAIKNIDDPVYLINFLATNIPFEAQVKQNLLEERSVLKRAYLLYSYLTKEAQLVDLKAAIQSRTREDISQQQREHFLQQQIRAIQEELGNGEDDVQELEERAK
ncbi:MAG: LON peptidase substrate-binding domain-containing protein, partial [Muribaculaceae bacterium]|nr:LON peptidase substrate-binding domain-containing protein [Muribaculaceae bacterium]